MSELFAEPAFQYWTILLFLVLLGLATIHPENIRVWMFISRPANVNVFWNKNTYAVCREIITLKFKVPYFILQ